MRGRRPDAIGQEAKGNPGRRKKGPSIEDRIRLLAEAPATDKGPMAPPMIFGLEEFKGAVEIWHEYVPEMRKRNILDRIDRHTMAMFCYYLDEWFGAVKQIATEGRTQKIKMIAGSYRIVDHPAIKRREDAAKIVLDISARFGFTPLDRHKLIREMVGTGAPTGGLFGDGGQDSASPPPASDEPDIIGFARPTGRPN